MAGITTLLLAVDASPASIQLIQRVVQMYPDELDKLHIVHVIKLPGNIETPDNYEPDFQRLKNSASSRLLKLLRECGISCTSNRLHLCFGEPSFQIKKLAQEIQADLVIVGSQCHEEDWLHLPGATTNCVIQGISTDVMAVKLPASK